MIAASSVLTAGQPASTAAQAADAIARLEMGKPIEREAVGTQEHVFQLALKAGEYAGLTVEQRGIDVIARVRDSGGRLLGEFDAESRTHGEEPSLVGVGGRLPCERSRQVQPGSGRPL